MVTNKLGACPLCHGGLAAFGDEVRCAECNAPATGHTGQQVDQVQTPEVQYRGGRCFVKRPGEADFKPVESKKAAVAPKGRRRQEVVN